MFISLTMIGKRLHEINVVNLDNPTNFDKIHN